MTAIAHHVDPWAPPADISRIACPGCGQTLDTLRNPNGTWPARHYMKPRPVDGGWRRLASGERRHYRSPNRFTVAASTRPVGLVCSNDSDQLIALVLIAQRGGV